MKRATLITLLVAVLLLATVGVAFAAVQNYRAHLSGKFEIPLVVDTQAQGQAIFQLSPDGTRLDYKLNVANIDNIFMAHIHLLPASGSGNGPIVVWLYPSTPFAPSQTVPPASWIAGRFDGVLAEGSITADNLVGPLAGMSLDKLIAEIEAGHAYVNVHTNDFIPPINTGPGDMFPGEIHGLIH
jgi:CHRD domain